MSKNSWGSSDPAEETKGGTGTATYTTGDILYSDASNSLAKLGIGSTDDVLTVASGLPSWAAQSGLPAGSGITFLSSATASTSATLDFTSLIDSTYNVYMFVLEAMLPATASGRLAVRISTDGGSSWISSGGSYNASYSLNGTGSTVAGTSMNTGPADVTTTAANRGVDGILYLFDPSTSSTKTTMKWDINYHSGSSAQNIMGAGTPSAANDVDGMRFLFTSGDIASGTVYMYGMVQPS